MTFSSMIARIVTFPKMTKVMPSNRHSAFSVLVHFTGLGVPQIT
jgi:hypothetical protein